MRAYRDTGTCGTGLLFNMLLEMIGPVAFGCLQWVGSLYTKAAERAVRNILGKFIQHIQIRTNADITDNTFQDACDTFDTEATRDAFTAGLFGEIAAAFHSPGDHTGIGRQQFDIGMVVASMTQDFTQRRSKGYFNDLWLTIRRIIVDGQDFGAASHSSTDTGKGTGPITEDKGNVGQRFNTVDGGGLIP